MDKVKQFLQGVELDNQKAALLTGAACGLGALVLLVQRVYRNQQTKDKIQRAQNLRAESLQRAEQAVLQYKKSVSVTDRRLEWLFGGKVKAHFRSVYLRVFHSEPHFLNE